LPTVSAVVFRVATSFDTVPVPNRVVPLKKSTVPVGWAGPVADGVIVAVNVTTCPETGKAGENVTVVVVVSCAIVTTVAGDEVLPR
jgi:hypothetical protein